MPYKQGWETLESIHLHSQYFKYPAYGKRN